MKSSVVHTGLFVAATLVGTLAARAESPGPRAFVLDPDGRNVKVLDAATGSMLATIELEGERPEHMWVTPDGTRVAVVHGIPGKTQRSGLGIAGWLPSARTTLSWIDTTSAKVIAKTELGWNWGDAAIHSGTFKGKLALFDFSALPAPDARRMTVLCPGVSSKKAEERLPAELVTVDWTEGKLVGRVTVDCVGRLKNIGRAIVGEYGPFLWSLSDVLLSADGGQLTLLCPGRDSKDPEDRRPGELVTIEPVPGRIVGQLPLERVGGHLLVAPKGHLAASLSPPSAPKKGTSMPAEISFIDLSGPSVLGSLKVDGYPTHAAFSPDGGLLYVLASQGPAEREEGSPARVFAVVVSTRRVETTMDAVAKLGRRPHGLRLSPDGRRLLVVADDGVTVLDLPGLKPIGRIATDARRGSSLIVSPDGRRGFLSWSESEELAILDLEALGLISTIKAPGVSKVSKLAGHIGKWVLLPVLMGVSAAGVSVPPNMWLSAVEPSEPPSDLQLSLSPDGKWVYAYNVETRKTAIANTETGRLLGVFRGRFRFLSGGQLFLGEGRGVTFIDPSSGKEVGKLGLAYEDLQISSDERYAVALTWDNWSGNGRVTLIDLSARTVIGEIKDFKDAEQILLVETPGARSR